MKPLRYFPKKVPPRPTDSDAPKKRLTKVEREAAQARKDKNHARYVVKTYGLNPGEYEEILASQNGRCAICQKRPRRRKLAVDHDHFDGRVRGLLCMVCNTSIGSFEYEAGTASRAADYLNRIAMDHTMRGPLVEPDKPGVATVPMRIEETGDLPWS